MRACGHRFQPVFENLELRQVLSTLAAHPGWKAESVISRTVHKVIQELSNPTPKGKLGAALHQGVDVHPAGLPLGAQWDIGTRWTALNTSVAALGTSVTTSGDGTVWESFTILGVESILARYNPKTTSFTGIWVGAGEITSLTAVSTTSVWAVFHSGKAYEINYVNGTTTTSAVPSLPGGDKFVQISAALDGTIWAIGASGNPYAYSSQTSSWTREPNGGAKLSAISVGLAGNIWAIGRIGNGHREAFHFINGNFQMDPYFVSKGPLTLISATADDTVWAVSNGTLYSRPLDVGHWSPVTDQTLPGTIIAISGVSQYRLNAIALPGSLYSLTYGLADQPATGFPQMDAGEAAGYAAISAALGVTAPGGIRTVYDNALYANSIPNWPAQIAGMNTPPPGVSSSDWANIKTQLYTETTDVGYVFALFEQMNTLTQQIETVASKELGNVANLVELSTTNESAGVQLFLEAMFEAELWATAAAGLPVGAAIAMSAIASGYGSALSVITGNPNPTSQTAIQTTEFKLSQQLDTLYTTANTDNGKYEDSILTDWGRLGTIGLAVHNGTLSWNYTEVSQIAQATDEAFDKYYFQTFMPLKWDIAAYKGSVPYYLPPDAPAYADDVIATKVVHNNTVYEYATVIHDKSGGRDPFLSPGPFPTQTLLNAIYAVGVTKNDLFTGANGWLRVNYY